MRHFIVLGFAGNSNKEPGKVLYVGPDHGKAIGIVNDTTGEEQRRELYELAVPQIRRHQVAAVVTEPAHAELYDQYNPELPPVTPPQDTPAAAKTKAPKKAGAKK